MKPDPCLSDPPDAKGTEEGANDTAVQATVTDIQKSHRLNRNYFRAQELCECQGGRPGSASLIVLMVSVDVKQH